MFTKRYYLCIVLLFDSLTFKTKSNHGQLSPVSVVVKYSTKMSDNRKKTCTERKNIITELGSYCSVLLIWWGNTVQKYTCLVSKGITGVLTHASANTGTHPFEWVWVWLTTAPQHWRLHPHLVLADVYVHLREYYNLISLGDHGIQFRERSRAMLTLSSFTASPLTVMHRFLTTNFSSLKGKVS